MSRPGEYEVGQLYLGEYRNGLKVWSQPGGIGTPVYPQLPTIFPWFEPNDGLYVWPGSYPAQYYWGCGHPANTAEIWSYYDPYDEEVKALITCPACSYIQRIVPYSQYQDYVQTPIVVA